MYSMACYDVAMLGVSSLMLCPKIQSGGIYQAKFSDLECEGYVTKADLNVAAIKNWIRSAKKIQPRLSNLGDDAAWQSAVAWMVKKSGLAEQMRYRPTPK